MTGHRKRSIWQALRPVPGSGLLAGLRDSFKDMADFEAIRLGEAASQELYSCYLTTLVGSEHLIFALDPDAERMDEALVERYVGTKYAEGDLKACIEALCRGCTVLCTPASASGIILETGEWQQRSVTQPQSENVIQGPMYAFNECYHTNVAMMRQRMRTPKLKLWETTVGEVAPVQSGMFYMEGITDEGLVQRIQQQFSKIEVDGIQDTGELLRLLGARSVLFPLAITTERPDRLASSLLSGKVVILLDGTPRAIVAPGAFSDFWEAAEDWYLMPFIAVFLRTIRFMALLTNLFLPSFYVAVTSVNIDVNRLEISLAAAGSREAVPYPVLVETLLILFLLDCIVEAGVRLPRTISATVTMVGGVVLGQAIIQANIVSNLLVIVAATTALTNFIVVDYQMGLVQRVLKYFVLIGAGVLGILGIVLSFAIMVVFLSRMESFGVAYLSPAGPRARVYAGDPLMRFKRGRDRHKERSG
ncbi:spore germination protein [Cohnella sp. JJ-181]|uniref:spore germination protein n=1 Tax=Cohnella rhizoplanae TaxID=2974897 RepID=UPI0022FFB221|nr:spore germination protein [Cohnella sp. JJ-181]CAI6076396.1 Spore germination protein A1 [Cohnella sp. JJ-181]